MQKQIAGKLRISRSALWRRWVPFWQEDIAPPPRDERARVLVLDGFFLRRRRSKQMPAVLIAMSPPNVYSWRFAKGETKADWMALLSSLPSPDVAVTDGGSAVLAAVRAVWPQAAQQRCMHHVQRYAGNLLRFYPRTAASRELAALAHELSAVRSFGAAKKWRRLFDDWESRHADALAEKVPYRLRVDRSHRSSGSKWLRLAWRHLSEALPHLFSFLRHAGCPRTTSCLEGGINKDLRRLLYVNAGLSPARQQTMIARFLRQKADQNPTQNPTQNET